MVEKSAEERLRGEILTEDDGSRSALQTAGSWRRLVGLDVLTGLRKKQCLTSLL